MNNFIEIQYYKTPVGELILGSFNNQLCLADWRYRKMRNTIDNRLKKELKANFIEKNSKIIKKTKQQLTEYFNQERNTFDIDLLFVGTEFQN